MTHPIFAVADPMRDRNRLLGFTMMRVEMFKNPRTPFALSGVDFLLVSP